MYSLIVYIKKLLQIDMPLQLLGHIAVPSRSCKETQCPHKANDLQSIDLRLSRKSDVHTKFWSYMADTAEMVSTAIELAS